MQIKNVTDREFKKYGKVLENYDFGELLEELAKIDMPADSVVYEPSVEVLEKCQVMKELENKMYGGLPIEIGYCNGNNSKLNAVEYHRSSEVDIAVNGLILLLGRQEDIGEDFTYDTANIEAFYLPAKMGVELYATTLHYAPCSVNGQGFQVAIVLPKGTNYPLEGEHAAVKDNKASNEDALITATNKWLIGHAEGGLDEGAFLGLKGKNLNVSDV